jgi:hypothetical protein
MQENTTQENAAAPVAARVENFSDIEVPADIKALRKAAHDFRDSVEKAQNKYWALCVLIRERQISPEAVQRELAEVGFRPERISEIKKVCFAPAALFEEFKARKVGFRLALARAREEEKSPVEQTELPLPKKTESASQRFKRELTEFLELSIPVSGPLPKMFSFTVKGKANGYAFSLKVAKQKTAV